MIAADLGLLAELAVRSSIVLGLAFVIAAFCRRISAEERHLVWACALLGILVLPVLPQPDLGLTLGALLPDPAAVLPSAHERGEPGEIRAEAAGALPVAQEPTRATVAIPARWPDVVLALYGAVALALLAWLALSSVHIGRSLRRLEDVTHAPTLSMLVAAAQRNGVRRRVRAKWSPVDATPLAWGFLRPMVVLPQAFIRLPPAEQRNAIEHEVAHIARWDFLITSLAWVCCAVYWFQPLAWLGCRRLMQESEIACDDRVLANGGSRRAYARQLVALARTVTAPRGPAAAMAGGASVSRRITAILDPTKRRKTMSRLHSILVLALATGMLVPVNALTAKPGMPAMAVPPAADGGTAAAGAREPAAAGDESNAAALLADAIARDGAPGCTSCYDALAHTGEASEAEVRVVQRAFELVEERARASGNGNLLVALAELCRQSGVEDELGRGMWYLMEGFRLGNLSDESSLAALSLLNDLGWYAQAKSLAQSLHDDPESGLYRSPETQQWIKQLDWRLSHAEYVTARLIAPTTTVTFEGDSVPLYRVPPTYPPQALESGQEGEVELGFTISETGHPEDVTVVSSSNPVFERPAADSLSQWLYAPNLVAGVPVEKQDERVVIRFVLVE